jgi:hypothetical protein
VGGWCSPATAPAPARQTRLKPRGSAASNGAGAGAGTVWAPCVDGASPLTPDGLRAGELGADASLGSPCDTRSGRAQCGLGSLDGTEGRLGEALVDVSSSYARSATSDRPAARLSPRRFELPQKTDSVPRTRQFVACRLPRFVRSVRAREIRRFRPQPSSGL